MNKYGPLSSWLIGQGANRVHVTFGQIEHVLGFDLPESAWTHPQWWENDHKHIQAKAWLDAGFRTEDVNLTANTLTFVRT